MRRAYTYENDLKRKAKNVPTLPPAPFAGRGFFRAGSGGLEPVCEGAAGDDGADDGGDGQRVRHHHHRVAEEVSAPPDLHHLAGGERDGVFLVARDNSTMAVLLNIDILGRGEHNLFCILLPRR